MKKMKKILSLVLALVMCLSLVNLSAFADAATEPTTESTTTETTESTTTETTESTTTETSEPTTTETSEPTTTETTDPTTTETTEPTTTETTEPTQSEETSQSAEPTESVGEQETTEDEESASCEHEWDDGEAVEGGTKYTCALCGESHVLADDDNSFDTNLVDEDNSVAQIDETGYETLQAAINAAGENETVTLLANVTENVTITGKDITLDLGGNTVNGGGNGTVLTINGGNVTLTGDGTITGGNGTSFPSGGGVFIKNDGTFTMTNGTITNNVAKYNGGGVFVDSGTFTMNGGTISNNNGGNNGGGVYVYDSLKDKSAKFVMYDGTISGNRATSGGGIGTSSYKQDEGKGRLILELYGGTIENNEVTGNGGGICMESTAGAPAYGYTGNEPGQHSMKISGNVFIRSNTAGQGGGVYSFDSITEISGATITGNTATGTTGGGGVRASGGTLTLKNVTISNNTAYRGGGIHIHNNDHPTHVTMESGTITGNTATQCGGGIYMWSGNLKDATTTTFAMTSGQIYGNTAGSHSADVYSNTATLTLSAASGTLDGKDITGWYWDGTPRWDGTGDDRGTISELTGIQCLIAAYKNDPVAKIVRNGEDVTFTTLQAAITAATDGETVEVLRDCTGASLQTAKKVTVNIPEDVTVSTNSGQTYALVVTGTGAELTITGAGTVEGSATSGNYGVIAQKGGTVNIAGGTIKGYRAVCGLTNAAINVTGENVSIDGTYAGIHAQGNAVNVLVNAGEVKGGTFGMFLSQGASATVEGTAKFSRTKDDGTGFTISLKGPGGDDDTVQHTSLTVNGGTITNTKNAAISGNGTVSGTGDARHTRITITGGEITSTESWGIYHPQQGEMTVTGGTITGITGIEMRAGTLNVSGNANITGTSKEYKYDPNSNGATTIGVGIALSQHVTERPITAGISGGTITGYHAVVEHDLENNPQSEHVTLEITGGLFTATGEDNVTVISDNFEKFITGGYFSDDLDAENAETAKYVADGYAAHLMTTPAGYYNVHIPNENGVEDCTICVAPTPITPTTYYTLTINYVDEDGNEVATRYSRSHASGYNYSVTSPIVDGMTPDQDVVSGRLTRNTTITVTYGSGVPTTDIPNGNVPLANVDDKLNTTDHFAYIIGYPEGDVRPNANITRAEAVTVFFRLMTEEFRSANWSSENTYPDVEASQWFNNAISTASKAGIFQGDDEGNARPNDAITRAEFAALAARFISDQITDDGTGDFADTADHWAAKEIRLAVKAGWIKGVGGNKFEPDRSITRAEVMTIVNRMLDRVADKDHMLSDMKVWSDNMDTSVWYYADVQEATNGHDYERVEGELTETWTKLQAPRDWAALEKEWSTAESGK